MNTRFVDPEKSEQIIEKRSPNGTVQLVTPVIPLYTTWHGIYQNQKIQFVMSKRLYLSDKQFKAVKHAVMDYAFLGHEYACPYHEKYGGHEMFCNECDRFEDIAEDEILAKFGLELKHTKTYRKTPRKVREDYRFGKKIT